MSLQLFCALLHGGHDDILKAERERLAVRCLRCGRVSHGVEIGRARDGAPRFSLGEPADDRVLAMPASVLRLRRATAR